MDAPQWGVSAVHCASGAAADGISDPPSERVDLRISAISVIRLISTKRALAEVGRYFTRLAEAEGLRRRGSPSLLIYGCLPSTAGRNDRRHAPSSRGKQVADTWSMR